VPAVELKREGILNGAVVVLGGGRRGCRSLVKEGNEAAGKGKVYPISREKIMSLQRNAAVPGGTKGKPECVEPGTGSLRGGRQTRGKSGVKNLG